MLNQNIVLCGSMKVKEQILETAKSLKLMEYNPILPEECLKQLPKNIASRAHFDRIIDNNNPIILVVNATKDSIQNYIGANSFAEIAFAYYYHKKIYLLNDIYEPYQEELLGWNVIALKGNLENISI